MAAVTDLQVDRERLCPGEKATVVATTIASPGENDIVTWTINGKAVTGLPQAPNTLEFLHGPPGIQVITASLDGSSLSVTVISLEAAVEMELEPDPADIRYVIAAEPRMQPPVVTARAVGIGGPISVLEWSVSIGIANFSDCPPNGPDLDTSVDLSPTGGGEQITIDLENVIRGGGIAFSVRGTVNGCAVLDFGGGGIDGTNPQQSDIQAALPHDALRRIACKESGQRQFDAPPNGGTGFCPLFGPGGKVGIMQIPDPTADEVWNWRLNVEKGIEIFNERVAAAGEYPSRVRNSEGFQNLVEQFNQRRQQQGLDPIQVILPDFTTGNFDDDLQQLELDAIRGYNGWEGSDQFGLELHEFRVAVDRIDGEEVLIVANVNEETLQGEAVWERVPVADRPADIGSPNYVGEVLLFRFDCSPSPPLCDLTGISPTTVTLFIGEPREFTAEGTSLDNVHWSAPGGTPPTGTGPTFTTKWLTIGKKTLTATCGGTTKTATVIVLRVSIEINNTPPAKDDIVQVRCDHPDRRFRVPCRIRLVGPASGPLTMVLTNPDGRLRFPGPADTTRTLVLPANGAFTAFDITGENASAAKGDAKIQARLNTTTGRVVTEKNVTVFTFDTARILLTQGGNYTLVGNNYTVAGGGVAVSFSSRARLRPAGLDCTAPQIANLRVAIMQESSAFLIATTWDSPTIAWDPSAPSGTTITVANTRRDSTAYDPTVAQPVNDEGLAGAAPLYDNGAAALRPPTGCAGAGAATSNDTPGHPANPTFFQDFSSGGTHVARVTWTNRVNTTRAEHFRTFCVVFNTATQEFCALRQAIWTLAVDSNGPPANQHAIVHADAAAAANPAVPPPTANTAPQPTTNSAVGAATTTFTKP